LLKVVADEAAGAQTSATFPAIDFDDMSLACLLCLGS
jgi:hypothetical protein